ncbi:hypothetical protein PPEP_b1153 [Pseudoalteromonas peptidolytica F12-50-A1]|uniref:Uncharacterized protein n=1 Tax=Pseudoalteromonas peptidolytica F12-50-A1 TaxID=1315280 RepID=A0A8I0N0C9_9GAMM|nr:hypothetical protein [Pseudoalteromonas peptidolytica F12-50-A1]
MSNTALHSLQALTVFGYSPKHKNIYRYCKYWARLSHSQ